MTTIAVPKQADYEDAGKVFEQMAFGLVSAADLTRNLDFRPGTFREARELQQAVDRFCQDRQDTLEVYSKACMYVGEIIRLCGETYTGSERQRIDKGSDLETRIGSALKGLQRLHGELDKIRQRGSTGLPTRRDREPTYHVMLGSDVGWPDGAGTDPRVSHLPLEVPSTTPPRQTPVLVSQAGTGDSTKA